MAAARANRRLRALAAALAPRSPPTAAPKPREASGGGGAAAFAPRLPDSPPSFRAGQEEREAAEFFDVYGFAILEEAHSPEECAPAPRPHPTHPSQAQLSNLGGRRGTGWRT